MIPFVSQNRLHVFETSLTEDTGCIVNPSRGWYEIYSFQVENRPDFEELKWCLREKQSLALLRIELKAIRSAPFSEWQLQNLDDIFHFFTDANKEMILRFAYDVEGKGKSSEPSDLQLILFHMRQLSPLFHKYSRQIYVIQGLFIGSWGEMHSSSYTSVSSLRMLASAMRSAAGMGPYMAVRMPVHLRSIMEEKQNDPRSFSELQRREEKLFREFLPEMKVGIFNDGLFGSPDHLGTFGITPREESRWTEPWNRSGELHFIESLCRHVPDGGEAVSGNNPASFSELKEELTMMHISYLNAVHDPFILDEWKKKPVDEEGVWKERSWYDYVGAHLGYRILIRDCRVKIRMRRILHVSLCLFNTGFAPLYDETEVVLSSGDGQHESRILLPEGIPDHEEKLLRFQLPAVPGSVTLTLRRVRDGKLIRCAMKEKKQSTPAIKEENPSDPAIKEDVAQIEEPQEQKDAPEGYRQPELLLAFIQSETVRIPASKPSSVI